MFQEYIHRVGRTARGEGGIGRALLFLRPEEVGFLDDLKEAKIPVEKFNFDWSKLLDIQENVIKKTRITLSLPQIIEGRLQYILTSP